MAETYTGNSDDSVVTKQVTADIDLDDVIDEYQALKAEYQGLPDLAKTEPDQETLDFWNVAKELERLELVVGIKQRATLLLAVVDPIRDAGLMPTRYETQYQQLLNFVNS